MPKARLKGYSPIALFTNPLSIRQDNNSVSVCSNDEFMQFGKQIPISVYVDLLCKRFTNP